nr:uncharacterized protein LOC113714395 isoform X1 [Coffea arabica]
MMEMLIGVLRFNDKDKAGRGFLTFCIEHFGSCSDFSPIIFGINLFNYVLEDFVRCIVGEMVYQILLRGEDKLGWSLRIKYLTNSEGTVLLLALGECLGCIIQQPNVYFVHQNLESDICIPS